MNIQPIINTSPVMLDDLSQSNTNRINNGHFENHSFSFYPWIPSGVVKLELNTGEALTGKNNVRFTPAEGEIGKITQRTRQLQVGELYMLLFAARSIGASGQLYAEFGRRLVRISQASLHQQKYSYYAFLFRARSKFSYLHFFVKGAVDVIIDIDTISLHSFSQIQKASSLTG